VSCQERGEKRSGQIVAARSFGLGFTSCVTWKKRGGGKGEKGEEKAASRFPRLLINRPGEKCESEKKEKGRNLRQPGGDQVERTV